MKKLDELISVIIPIYNCEEYIERCIKSVLDQNYSNIELILVNDGSSDKSGEICDKYESIDNRVKVIHQANVGVSKTREKATKISKGKWLIFIDSDDYIKNDYISTLYNEAKLDDIDIVCCNSIDFENKELDEDIRYDEIIKEKSIILKDYFNLKRYPCVVWGKIIKKDILLQEEFPHMKYGEDTYLIVKSLLKASKVKLLKYSGYYYTYRENSASNTIKDIDKFKDLIKRDIMIYNLCKNEYEEFAYSAEEKVIESIYGLIKNLAILSRIQDIKESQKYKKMIKSLKVKKIKVKIKKIIIKTIWNMPNLSSKIAKIFYRKRV